MVTLFSTCGSTKIQLVRTFLKVAAGLALVAILGLGVLYVIYLNDDTRCDAYVVTGCSVVTLKGDITPEMFVEIRKYLVESTAPKKTLVIEASGGGNGFAALAIAILVHRHRWDVEVVNFCISSCANFIFPAGKTKYLHRDSIIVFHGGPYQANLLEYAIEFDRQLASGNAVTGPVTFGQKDKEGTVTFRPGHENSPAEQEVFDFLSVNMTTAADYVLEIRRVSDRFYEELGIDPRLSIYGQIGEYEPIYRSYDFYGFMYRLDALRRLGIGNIELKDGEWHPERNPEYARIYEVAVP
jgi:hypothetical protein